MHFCIILSFRFFLQPKFPLPKAHADIYLMYCGKYLIFHTGIRFSYKDYKTNMYQFLRINLRTAFFYEVSGIIHCFDKRMNKIERELRHFIHAPNHKQKKPL